VRGRQRSFLPSAGGCRFPVGPSVVVEGTTQPSDPSKRDASTKHAAGNALNPWRIDWATLLRRTYDLDVLKCRCGGRLKAAELVTDAVRAKEFLERFGMSTKPPPIARARLPDWGRELPNKHN
jgi:hypothetical protein